MAKILLAEDDSSMRDFLTLALTKAGHEVLATSNGLDALEALKADQSFELLLSDIVMPGMDGIELSRSATNISPKLKVMFITGFAAVAMGQQNAAPERAAPRVLPKPFHLKELVGQVESLLKAA
ncbi:MAG: response regulator [Alphaproteobacteria bacterium]